jgi:acyl-CoA thioesterase
MTGVEAWGDLSDLVRQIDVPPLGNGVFEAPAYRELKRNVIEGSELLGQAIVAASRIAEGQRVVSAHAIFSRAARFDRPLRLDASLRRKGRGFSTAAVEISQDGKSVASALALLDRGAPDVIRHQAVMPDVPSPEASESHDFGITGREVRIARGAFSRDPAAVGPPELNAWLRFREGPDDPALRQGLLTQFMGRLTIASAMRPHRGVSESMAHRSLSTGVLSLSVAHHEDADYSQWLLYSNTAIQAGNGLAQVEGRVFAQDGRLLASGTSLTMVRAPEGDPAAHGGFARFM